MEDFIGMDAFASAPDFGGFGMAPDLENAFQAWLADGNTGTLSDFLSEQGGSSEAFSTDSGSEGEAADTQKDAPLIAPEAPKQEYGGLLSNQPMIGLDRALTPPPAPASMPAPALPAPQTANVFQDIGPRLKGDLMRDFNLSREQAAGVVGNLAHESGGFRTLQEISPLIPGSRGGWGYAQWTGPRRRAFESWADDQGLDRSSYEANYGFLRHELQNTPERRVLDNLREAPDTATATRIFNDQFLRPGIPHMASRQTWAQRALGFDPASGEDAPRFTASAFAPEPMPRPGNLPTSYESRMAGIGAFPVEQNGFTQASFPRVEMMTTSPAEALRDTPGLLNPEVTMPGRAPLANTPTMRGAIDPGFIYQEQPRPLPDMPSASPNAVPDVIRNAPSNARPLMAAPSREADKPAPNANTAKGRSPMQPQDIPPDYSTWADAGIQDFLRRDAEARGAVLPNPFGGIGAAVSSGLSSIGGLLRGGSGEAPAALPAPPVGQSPVARAAPVGVVSAQSDPSTEIARVNPPRPSLNPLGFFGEARRRNDALESEWQGKVALVDELERRGLSRAEAVSIINNPTAMQLAMGRLSEDRARRQNAEFSGDVARAIGGGQQRDAGTSASPPPTSQQPRSDAPPSEQQVVPRQDADPNEARRQRLTDQAQNLRAQLFRAPTDTARKNLEALIEGIERQIKAIPDPLDRRKRELDIKKLENELDGGSRGSREVQDREKIIRERGLDPKDPRFQAYILTGKMPREDAQPLTATDKKAILEADEAVMATEGAIKSLREAVQLSPRAMGGITAATRATLGNNIPDMLLPNFIASPQQAQDTANLQNLITTNALSQLRSIFGAAPTEGERQILLDIQGSVSQPDAVRQQIYQRAIRMAEKRLEFNRDRATQLRGGDFYKPSGGGENRSGQGAASSGQQSNQPSQQTNTPNQPQSPERTTAIRDQARDAIARGANPEAVRARLKSLGIEME